MSRRGPVIDRRRVVAAAVLAVFTGVAASQLLWPGGVPPERLSAATVAPQAAVDSNDPCYVCHMPFLEENLATAHAKVQVWCGTCHGPSRPHIEDENIGATPPDVVHKKDEVDRMCGQCHNPEEHSVLTGKTRSARLAEGKQAQQEIKGPKIEVTGVCTDCHGRHWIPPRGQPNPPQGSPSDPGTGSTAYRQEQADAGSQSSGAGCRPLGGYSARSLANGRPRHGLRASHLISSLATSRTSRRARVGHLAKRPETQCRRACQSARREKTVPPRTRPTRLRPASRPR